MSISQLAKPFYRLDTRPEARIRLWGADGLTLAAKPRGGGDRKIYSNSFGEQYMMTVARSIYKAPQQETDRGGGYVLVRWVDAAQGRLSGQEEAGAGE